jgi:hypothetical protein
MIQATPLGLGGQAPGQGNDTVDVTVSCPVPLAGASAIGLRSAHAARQNHCAGHVAISAFISQAKTSLDTEAQDVARSQFLLGSPIETPRDHYQGTLFLVTARALIKQFPALTEDQVREELIAAPWNDPAGIPGYIIVFSDATLFTSTWGRLRAEYEHLVGMAAGSSSRVRSLAAQSASVSTDGLAAIKGFTLRAGARGRIRLVFSRGAVRDLTSLASAGMQVVPVRVVIAFDAKPYPVARFFDIALRIQQKKGKGKGHK